MGKQEEQTVVLYPSPGIGHLISMVELGKLMLTHYPSLSLTVLITTPPWETASTTPYIKRMSQTTPSICFHHLPTISLSLDFSNFENLVFELLRVNNPSVHHALQTISETSTIKAFIIDMFCTDALELGNELHIPTFYFITSGVSALAVFLYFSKLHHDQIQTTTQSFKDLHNTLLHIPGVPPILATDMPNPMLDLADSAYEGFLNMSAHIPKSEGIIINSFESLEPRAIRAIRDGLCVFPNSTTTPPLYPIGPLIADRDESKDHECMRWLDSQPTRSVVFLCFGSVGLFSVAQLEAIATGLEKSGQRFLWMVRSPPPEDKIKFFLAPVEPDLNVLLPHGFLDRTKDRGLVVKSWAPQVEVLSHKAVGGFVSHCGWNSALEAICAGVPMVAWPLYAEQRINKVFLVQEMKIALPMEEVGNRYVKATEIEQRVRQLMDSEEGKMVRQQMEKMRAGAQKTISEGGSSLTALRMLVESWKH